MSHARHRHRGHGPASPSRRPVSDAQTLAAAAGLNREPVGAATIASVSGAAGRAGDPPPTVAEILADLPPEDALRIRDLARQAPPGMVLAPVLMTPITREENAAVWAEYMDEVQVRFLRHLGRAHADDLRKVGFDDTAIGRLAEGLYPETGDGRQYGFDVDHVIERSGSGSLGLTKSVDPAAAASDPAAPPTFGANHFANLFFLPHDVHELKNDINGIQYRAARLGRMTPRWMAMLVPDRSVLGPSPVLTTTPARPWLPRPDQVLGQARATTHRGLEQAEALASDPRFRSLPGETDADALPQAAADPALGPQLEKTTHTFRLAIALWEATFARYRARTPAERADPEMGAASLVSALGVLDSAVDRSLAGDLRPDPGDRSVATRFRDFLREAEALAADEPRRGDPVDEIENGPRRSRRRRDFEAAPAGSGSEPDRQAISGGGADHRTKPPKGPSGGPVGGRGRRRH